MDFLPGKQCIKDPRHLSNKFPKMMLSNPTTGFLKVKLGFEP